MKDFRPLLKEILAALRSPRGKNLLVFAVFLCISALLWLVLTINQEEQFDLRMPVKITHVPDSVTLVNPGPEAVNVSLSTKGTELLRYSLGAMPTMKIDFRAYRSPDGIHLSSADLKALARSATGGAAVSLVYPDSITISYTTHPGYRVPVKADYKVTPGPKSAIVGRPSLAVDSALVFMPGGKSLPYNFDAVTTEPVKIDNLDETTTRRVKLVGPKGSRVIPDSTEITFYAEPLIIKSRKVVIEPVNVPRDIKLITFPAQIEVFYMVPMSTYTASDPHFRVLADYRRIRSSSKMMKLRLVDVPADLQNVHLSSDSAEYIIEHL